MITKTDEQRAFTAEKENNGYFITAKVVADSNDVIKSIDTGDVFLADRSVQVANFYKYLDANTSITLFNGVSIKDVAIEIDIFINELTNTTV